MATLHQSLSSFKRLKTARVIKFWRLMTTTGTKANWITDSVEVFQGVHYLKKLDTEEISNFWSV
jgi:hypothetical protein